MPPSDDAVPVRTRSWVSFTDPDDGDEWLFDLTFLTSSWTCIFGRGCQGVLAEPAPDLALGCCSYGAHFADDDDLRRVADAAARLTSDTWQHRAEALRRGGPFKRQGDATVTRLVDGSCIFLNRVDSPQGPGCALHLAALEEDERPLDWKPEVCWQLPLRLTHEVDENDRTTHTLRSWDRADWGGGGAEFHWWCTEGTDAFVGHVPVYVELRDEIVELVGAARYRWLVEHLEGSSEVVDVPAPVLKKRA